VSTTSTGPSVADAEKPPHSLKIDPPSSTPTSPEAPPRSTSVHIKSVVAEEITQSPSEAGAEVLLTLKSAKPSDSLRRIAASALSNLSSGPSRCRVLLSKRLAAVTLTQEEHQESTAATIEGESVPTHLILNEILTQETGNLPTDDESIETGPSPSATAAVEAPPSLGIDGTEDRQGLRSDDAQNLLETVTLADSLTSDEDDSVVSDPFSKLSDSPKDPHIVVAGSVGSSAQGNVEDGRKEIVLAAVGDAVPELDEGKIEGASPEDQLDEAVKPGHVSFLSEFRKRHHRRSLPTVVEDKDLVGSEIKCITSQDEAESLQRNTSILSTASSILMDDRSGRILRARTMRNHGKNCEDNCDCLGSGNYEDRSVEFSNGSSIMSDESDYEYSEASVPTCYICLQVSEARGPCWQDLK
jgi:hypothetical protein